FLARRAQRGFGAGGKADRRLVEDVADAAQVGAELRRQPDALRLAAGQRRRRAVERQVAEPDLLEEIEAAVQFCNEVPGDFARSVVQFYFLDLILQIRNGQIAKIGDD